MGWSLQNVIARIVEIVGPSDGLFLYSGVPGPGNGPIAWESTATVDPFGNVLPGAPALGLNGLPFLAYGQLSSAGFVVQVSTTPGPGSFSIPGGVSTVKAEAWGGSGGGSSGCNNGTLLGGSTGKTGAGVGGGGGEYASEPALAVSGSVTFSVGSGGAGGAAPALASPMNGGSPGGLSTITGSSVTVVAHGGGATTNVTVKSAGGTGSTNSVHFNGGAGGLTNGYFPGFISNEPFYGGGGGGSGGSASAGNAGGTGTNSVAGAGGAAVSGGGAGGAGGSGAGSGSAGGAGSIPGGAGGGGGLNTGGGGSNPPKAGAAGANGQIRITYTTGTTLLSLLASLAVTGGTDQLGNFYPPGWTVGAVAAWIIPSGDASGATDFTNISTAISEGYQYIQLLPGNFFTNSTINLGIGQWVIGCGMAGTNGTVVNWVGTGDCFRQTSSAAFNGTTTVGGGISELTIDGTNHTVGASAGIHVGDIQNLVYERLQVRGFSGTGDIGFHFDNQYHFTERMTADIVSVNNTSHVVFDVSDNTGGTPHSSTKSYARPRFRLWFNLGNITFNVVTIQNGALIYDAEEFTISGNCTSGSSGTPGAILTVTGVVPPSHPDAGASAGMQAGHFDVGVETDSILSVRAQTIKFGASGNYINNTFGMLDFDFGNPVFTASNLQTIGATFQHWGPVFGDANLASTDYSGTYALGALGTGGTIPTRFGGNTSVNPAGAVTGVILNTGSRDGQRCTVVNLSANLVTFAIAATSNVAAGASATVPANTSRLFIWNAAAGLWFGGT